MSLAALMSMWSVAASGESILGPQKSCFQVRFPRLDVRRNRKHIVVGCKSFIISDLAAAAVIFLVFAPCCLKPVHRAARMQYKRDLHPGEHSGYFQLLISPAV